MRPFLVEVSHDTVGRNGWLTPMHDEVTAQAGEWQLFVYWFDIPKSLSLLGKSYNGLALVDVANFSLITSGYPLPIDFIDKQELLNYINSTQASTLPAPIRNKLTQAGFTVGGTIAEMLQDIM